MYKDFIVKLCKEQIRESTPLTGAIVENLEDSKYAIKYRDDAQSLTDKEYWERNFFMALIYLEFYNA